MRRTKKSLLLSQGPAYGLRVLARGATGGCWAEVRGRWVPAQSHPARTPCQPGRAGAKAVTVKAGVTLGDDCCHLVPSHGNKAPGEVAVGRMAKAGGTLRPDQGDCSRSQHLSLGASTAPCTARLPEFCAAPFVALVATESFYCLPCGQPSCQLTRTTQCLGGEEHSLS